ncbi:MAG TPA: hypothetical protein VHM23_27380 [Actinomycetota bacterium]|jgi:hypothetical protein|nr:hypothetical protein [Actinomycetota bacterium]
MLDHAQAQPGQVEHLAGLDPDHRRAGQVRAAASAPVGQVLDHLVGGGDLGQVGAGGAGLLAGPPHGPLSRPTFDTAGLAQPV